MPLTAVIILNWNGKENTLACLASLQKLQASIIVIDNASMDDSVATIRKKFPKVQLIENKTNLGFAAGNNLGIKRALSAGVDYLWLLNNDTLVDDQTHRELIKTGAAYPQAGIIGGKIYFAKGFEFHSERYQKSEKGKVLWYAGGLIDWRNIYASHRGVDEVDRGQYDKPEITGFVTGCSMFIKKEVIKTIGIFDERYYLYWEDVDFCLRARSAGYQLLYIPKAIIWHKNASSSGRSGNPLQQYYFTRNRFLFAMKHAPWRSKIAVLHESLRLATGGNSFQKQGVKDALLGHYGKGGKWEN